MKYFLAFVFIVAILIGSVVATTSLATSKSTIEKSYLADSMDHIKNFHPVSDRLASSGSLRLKDYKDIKQYGFQRVINLIPGEQTEEKKHVESLGLSYEQIEVIWDEPTLKNFETFVKHMKNYGDDKVYVRCKLNWRASTFVYLYRVTQLGEKKEVAMKDLRKIWKPNKTWKKYMEAVESAY